jgi:thioredoxin-like negative regulator of GroEL
MTVPGTLQEVTKDNFRELVSEGTTLVDMWGPDCTTCLALMPDVERIAEEKQNVKVVTLEAPKARRLCMELKVMGLPAFLLFRDGEEVSRLAGPSLSAPALEKWLDENLGEVS